MMFLSGFALGIVVGVAAVIVMALCVGAVRRSEEERVDDWAEYAAMRKRERQAREGRG